MVNTHETKWGFGNEDWQCMRLTILFILCAGLVVGLSIWCNSGASPLFANDASKLNETVVQEIWDMPNNRDEAIVELRELLKYARKNNMNISIAGSQHSMGGQTLLEQGLLINTSSYNGMSLDEERNILTVKSGTTWDQILHYIDERGRSVAIMQSK